MKSYCSSLLLLLCCLLGFTSCEFEASPNGDLDGFWQLAQVDTIGGGSRDMAPTRLFWSFQMNLLQLSDQTYRTDTYYLRFEQKEGHLSLSDPYLSNRAQGDEPLTDPTPLRPYGIQSLNEVFIVESLTDDHLLLQGTTLRLSFNRY